MIGVIMSIPSSDLRNASTIGSLASSGNQGCVHFMKPIASSRTNEVAENSISQTAKTGDVSIQWSASKTEPRDTSDLEYKGAPRNAQLAPKIFSNPRYLQVTLPVYSNPILDLVAIDPQTKQPLTRAQAIEALQGKPAGSTPAGTYLLRVQSAPGVRTKGSAALVVLSIIDLDRNGKPRINNIELLFKDGCLGKSDFDNPFTFLTNDTEVYKEGESLKECVERWILKTDRYIKLGTNVPRYLPSVSTLSSNRDQSGEVPYPILALAIDGQNKDMDRAAASEALKNAVLNTFLFRPLSSESGGDALGDGASACVMSLKTLNDAGQPNIVHTKLLWKDKSLGKSYANKPSEFDSITKIPYTDGENLREFVKKWVRKHQPECAIPAANGGRFIYYQSEKFQVFKEKNKLNDDFFRALYSIPLELLDAVIQKSLSDRLFLSSELAFSTFQALAKANGDFLLSSVEVSWLNDALNNGTNFLEVAEKFVSVRSILQKEGMDLKDYISSISNTDMLHLEKIVVKLKNISILNEPLLLNRMIENLKIKGLDNCLELSGFWTFLCKRGWPLTSELIDWSFIYSEHLRLVNNYSQEFFDRSPNQPMLLRSFLTMILDNGPILEEFLYHVSNNIFASVTCGAEWPMSEVLFKRLHEALDSANKNKK